MIAAIAAFTLQCHGELAANHEPVSERLIVRGGTARVSGSGDKATADGLLVRRTGSGLYRLTAMTRHTPEFDVYAELQRLNGRSPRLRWYSRPRGGQGPIQFVSDERCTLISGKIPS